MEDEIGRLPRAALHRRSAYRPGGERRGYPPSSWKALAVLEFFTCDTFKPHVGGTFRVHVDDRKPLDVRLTEAVELPAPPGDKGRIPFSLVFVEPDGLLFPQRIYGLEHPEIGRFELFLVPLGPDDEGMRYQAVFT